MNSPDRLRALLAKPGFVVMPAVWDGLSARLTHAAGFATAFLSGSCVAASRLGGPDLDLLSFGEMFDSLQMVRGAAPDRGDRSGRTRAVAVACRHDKIAGCRAVPPHACRHRRGLRRHIAAAA